MPGGFHNNCSSLVDIHRHPCFDAEARHTHARIHLPVAPHCNMQCNYCNRKFSCVNESRPGVTSKILTPGQAISYLRQAAEKLKNLSVVGIAGPGDPFANAFATLETLSMVKAEFPHLLLCVATNGLNLFPYIDDLLSIGISHVTVTVNAVNPTIGARFYEWVDLGNRRLRGAEAAVELWQVQAESIRALASKGVIVKINTIYTPGINDAHIETVAKTVSVLGASILNVMPLLPTAQTPFAAIGEPDRAALKRARVAAQRHIPQMTHCSRCRADAVGLLGEQNNEAMMEMLKEAGSHDPRFAMLEAMPEPRLTSASALRFRPTTERPNIAVATRDGLFINQHLGETSMLHIYRPGERRSALIDRRSVQQDLNGPSRWLSIVEKLRDCAGLLVSGAGAVPRKLFAHYGIPIAIVEGSIDEALSTIAMRGDLAAMAKPGFHCSTSCSGDHAGCE